MTAADVVLGAEELGKHYPVRRLFRAPGAVRALDGVSFRLARAKTLAVVGESGCGKSTLARLLMRLESPTFGRLELDGRAALDWPEADYRRKIQMIFQDPYSSLNPRKKALDIVAEPLAVNLRLPAKQRRERAAAMLEKTGLAAEHFGRYPHMFSGGQRQRIGIARALILNPEIVVCDEPVSALDVSVQAQVLNLLMDLQDEFKLSYVFISHDLAVVRHVADDVLVMYLGRVMEHGTRVQIFTDAQHPYTRSLLASTPDLSKSRGPARPPPVAGDLPSVLDASPGPPRGCPFQARCPEAFARCAVETPPLRALEDGRKVACHLTEPSLSP